MNKIHALSALVLGSALLAGCGILKKKQSEPTPTAAPTVAAVPSTPVVAPTPTPTAEPAVTVADDAIPAPEDFEDEAFEKVTDKTYKEQLAGLKKEIEAK